jgi:hypothetical protein
MLTGMTSGSLDAPALLTLLVHELRTPANVVGGYLRMLQDPRAGALSDRQAQLVAHALRSWDQLVAMLADASALARLQRGEGRRPGQPLAASGLAAAAAAAFVAPHPGTATLTPTAADPAPGAAGHPVPLHGDAQALALALAACARAVARGARPPAHLVVSPVVLPDAAHVAFLLAPEPAVRELRSPQAAWQPADRLRGGLGLEFLLAAASIEAAGGQVEQPASGPGVGALRVVLPVRPAP